MSDLLLLLAAAALFATSHAAGYALGHLVSVLLDRLAARLPRRRA